jgi:hypothetical protein
VLKYLKSAFSYHWNLLAFFSATGFAMLSGHPDVVMPIVLAGEVVYLGLLASNPRYQSYVDRITSQRASPGETVDTEQLFRRMLATMPPRQVQRFEALRSRCMELRQIAMQIKDPTTTPSTPTLDEMQLAGLDRLLWIFLRLLFTQHSLERFLHTTSRESIQRDIHDLTDRLEQAKKTPDETQRQRLTKAIEDNLQTCHDRLANYEKARGNYELMQLEIDRLENKIQSLSELAVNRQEPDFISSQVDQVASSMIQTERTMNELEFATGLEVSDDAVPSLLRPKQTA